MTYLVWKTIHVASVVIFLGNIATGLFWASHALTSRDLGNIAATFEGISKSDRWFTVPGVIGILASGVAAAVKGHLPILGTSWILWSVVLFSISGIVFGVWLAPLQQRLIAIARAADDSEAGWNTFNQAYRKWETWGLVALLAPAAALVIMVLKPELPGL